MRTYPELQTTLLASLVLLTATPAAAQVTLLVRDDATIALGADTGVANSLRAGLGGSVHRLDPSLEEMALAAGCAGDPGEPACIASFAAATHAQTVAIERTSRATFGWRLTVELRRGSNGSRVRTVQLECAARTDCIAQLTLALRDPMFGSDSDPVPVVVDSPLRAASVHAEPSVATVSTPEARAAPVERDRVVSSHDADPARATPVAVRAPERARDVSLVPIVLFGSAVAMSVGAMIAGGVGLAAGQDAYRLGLVTSRDQADHLASLESSRDWGLGVGTGLAITGACLAIVGAVWMAMEPHRRDDSSVRLAGAFDLHGAMLALTVGYP